jgi:hypothetical protein
LYAIQGILKLDETLEEVAEFLDAPASCIVVDVETARLIDLCAKRYECVANFLYFCDASLAF